MTFVNFTKLEKSKTDNPACNLYKANKKKFFFKIWF